MTSQKFKKSIENKNITSDGQIFVCAETFVPKQWITEIGKILNKEIVYTNNIKEIKKTDSLFGNIKQDVIKVYITDTFNDKFTISDYCYVICKKSNLDSAIVIGKLERWQILDYATFNSSNLIDKGAIEDLVDACNLDINRVSIEIEKYSIFENDTIQKSIFDRLYNQGQLPRSYSGTIFDFTNALLNNDIQTLLKFYRDIQHYDIEPLGVVTIIYKQLKNLIMVGFNKNPTEENTGLSSKQIYWIRKNLGKYDSNYILKSFQFICESEKLLKEGTITNNQLVDYIVVNLLR